MVVLEDIIEEYIAKFNEEPQYPRGTEGEAIDLLIGAIEARSSSSGRNTNRNGNCR